MQSNAFYYAHACADDERQVIDRVLSELKTATGNLGFLYVTEPLGAQLEDILDQCRTVTGVEHWVGAVSSGVCATGVEYYERPAAAMMIADLPANSFRVFSNIINTLKPYDAEQQQWLGNALPYMGLVHGDPSNPTIEELIKQLAARTATGFLVGGLASSDAAPGCACVISESAVSGGLTGVLFTEAVGIRTGLTQGCSPIGPVRHITDAQRNVLIQLDGRPALEVFKEDIGSELANDLERVAGTIFVGLPVMGSDTGDYLVRNLIGLDLTNQLLAIGELVEKGQDIRFCRRDTTSARDDLIRMLHHLKGRLDGPPRGGVYISCLGRGASLFGDDAGEIRHISEELGEFPLVGFYANGEIFQDRLYGYTGILTLFI
ncbi:FIST signal transduction protein [Thiospirillum jenense]|uniref:FIST C-terminal domain-containing protein n=1 Tax=Thiospirillum jenense TaxID=1653858 RepID=A0A839HF14_9GAMM|nr:FIST N-terminal domain-containing protein [Thiospirillum jenense]MBB1126700.1 FIST C-terminal domain-containing protein [Thiospirillum jenense]